jgi:hypothetical protein
MNSTKKMIGIGLSVFIILTSSLIRFTDADSISNSIQFNDNLVENQILIVNEIEQLEMRLLSAKDRSSAQKDIRNTILEIEDIIIQTETLNYPNNAEELRLSAIDLFNFYKEIVEIDYSSKLLDIYFANNLTNSEFLDLYTDFNTDINNKIQTQASKFEEVQLNYTQNLNISTSADLLTN